MEVVICRDAAQVGIVAAEKVADRLRGRANPVIGLATGSSPLDLYAHLAKLVDDGALDLSQAYGFALDEYVGLAHEHPESYHAVIHRTVTEPLRMNPARVRVPNGMAADLVGAAQQYEEAIRAAGGVDVQVLGIGSNGHIGFNEPFTSFGSRTHRVPLTEQTRNDNARFFDSMDQVPTHALTQGLGTIMDSRTAVLVATGEHKADAVAAMIEGPVAIAMPASILQFHPDVHVVLDEAAAAKLASRDHFHKL